MIAAAIDKILSLGGIHVIESNEGVEYCNTPLYRVHKGEDLPATISVSTLNSFTKYVEKNIDEIELDEAMVLVESPTRVLLISKLFSDNNWRKTYISCDHRPSKYVLEHPICLEDFVVALSTCFKPTDSCKYLINFVSAIKVDNNGILNDTGYSQKVTVQKGVSSLVEAKEAPNPVVLNPYRTFPEIDQPSSNFIFRIKDSDSVGGLRFSLTEVMDNKWRLDAVKSIRFWIEEEFSVHGIQIPVLA